MFFLIARRRRASPREIQQQQQQAKLVDIRNGREEEAGRGKRMYFCCPSRGGVGWGRKGMRDGSGKWMAATFNFVPPAGYTFGVLAFLRSLRVWGPGLREEREGSTGVGSG